MFDEERAEWSISVPTDELRKKIDAVIQTIAMVASPDMSPSDYLIFGQLKIVFQRCTFHSDEEMHEVENR